VRPSELQGKKIVGTEARIVGTIADIEFDPENWRITNLHVELTDESVETLGYNKPRFGHVTIQLSVKAVKAVADVVSLKKPVTELRDLIAPPK
jgi:sporulation protein YlmC with PRC-barrel domain